MLPAVARLRRRDEFSFVLRSGSRAGRSSLVVHLAQPAPLASEQSDTAANPAVAVGVRPRAGFVVSKAVGNSVVRHRVVRRLRHLMLDRLAGLPPGSMVVVRALPAAADRSSAGLGRDLDSALARLLSKSGSSAPGNVAKR
jgi:ribonuclease P protein component